MGGGVEGWKEGWERWEGQRPALGRLFGMGGRLRCGGVVVWVEGCEGCEGCGVGGVLAGTVGCIVLCSAAMAGHCPLLA